VFALDPDVTATLEEYVRLRGPRLVRTAYLLTGDRQLAEDLVQNALASAMVSWRRLRDVTDLDAYLHTAVVNAQNRWWRRRWHGEIPTERLPEAAAPDETAKLEGSHDLLEALRRLPARQREAVVLRYYEDLSEAQAARVLGCSVGTVKSQTSRGLAKLRLALEARPAGGRLADGGGR
jgi:RNA polymerase sigma-70 factor (sigma-E family)